MRLTPKYQLPVPDGSDNRDIPRDLGGIADRLEVVLPTLGGATSSITTGVHAAAKVANGVYRVTHGMGRKPEHVIPHYGVGGTGDALVATFLKHSETYVTSSTYFYVVVRYGVSDALYTGSTVNVGWIGW